MTFSAGRSVRIAGAIACALSIICCGGGESSDVVTTADGAVSDAGPDAVPPVEAPAAESTTVEESGSGPAAGESPPANEGAVPEAGAGSAERIEPLPVTEEYSPETAAGVLEGVPAATNTAPIVALANYFADLPGIDMSQLTPSQKEKFLHRANSELCTCGCKDDTLARCYVNDPNCPVVKGLLLDVLHEVASGK